MINNSILIATNGLAGYALANDKVFATLPVTAYIVGAALTTVPASLLTGAAMLWLAALRRPKPKRNPLK